MHGQISYAIMYTVVMHIPAKWSTTDEDTSNDFKCMDWDFISYYVHCSNPLIAFQLTQDVITSPYALTSKQVGYSSNPLIVMTLLLFITTFTGCHYKSAYALTSKQVGYCIHST